MEVPPIVAATSAPELPEDVEPPCVPCGDCGRACAKTDEVLCWECSQFRERDMEIGGEG